MTTQSLSGLDAKPGAQPAPGRGPELDTDEIVARILAPGQDDPYPLYAALREKAPVVYSKHFGAYLLSRYEDCERVLRNPRQFRSIEQETLYEYFPQAAEHEAYRVLFTSMVNLNPPAHARVRRVAAHALTPRRVESLRPQVRAVCDELLDAAELAMADGRAVDLHKTVSMPLPLRVLAALLGVPDDRYGALAELVPRMLHVVEPNPTPESMALADQAFKDFAGYVGELIAERRAKPQDDLISALAVGGQDEDALSDDELATLLMTLWAAGFETPAITIDNAVLLLLRRPELRAHMRDEESAEAFADELLRWETPGQISTGRRYAVDEADFGGVTIPAGSQIRLLLGAANRDPRAYPDADEFLPGRAGKSSLAFGAGLHFCIGSGLAKMQMGVLLPRIARRFPDLRPIGDPVRRRSMPLRDFSSFLVGRGGSEDVPVRVLLEGGPRELPGSWQTPAGAGSVKIPFRGGYEHFAPTGRDVEADGGVAPVFGWVRRTEVAE